MSAIIADFPLIYLLVHWL